MPSRALVSAVFGLLCSLLAIYLVLVGAAERSCEARGGALVVTASPGFACVARAAP